jgi:hypothetical protein
MIPDAGASNVTEFGFGVVNPLKIGIVAYAFNASCKGITSLTQAITASEGLKASGKQKRQQGLPGANSKSEPKLATDPSTSKPGPRNLSTFYAVIVMSVGTERHQGRPPVGLHAQPWQGRCRMLV